MRSLSATTARAVSSHSRRLRVCEGHLEVGQARGERALQLVGRVGDEPPFSLGRVLQAVEHVVHGGGQAPDLVARRGDRHAPAEVLRGDLRDLGPHRLHGTQGAADDEPGDRPNEGHQERHPPPQEVAHRGRGLLGAVEAGDDVDRDRADGRALGVERHDPEVVLLAAHRDLLGADLRVVVLGAERGDGRVLLEVGAAGDGMPVGGSDVDVRVLVAVDREGGVEPGLALHLRGDIPGPLHGGVVEVLVERVAQDGQDDRRADEQRAGDDEARRRCEPGPDAGESGEAATRTGPIRHRGRDGTRPAGWSGSRCDRTGRRSSCAGTRRRPRRC